MHPGLYFRTQQGDATIFGVTGPSITRWYTKVGEERVKSGKGSLFLGLSIGINTATPEESVQNNITIGACYVDEIGACGGITGDSIPGRGIGPVRPCAGVAVGDGLQVTSGPSYSVNLLYAINNWFARYLGGKMPAERRSVCCS
jgi:hypothetical protein